MEGEQKRVFLVLADDEIAGIRPPKGIYFTKFLSAAQEMWISEKMMKQKRNPYVLTARSMLIPGFSNAEWRKESLPFARKRKEQRRMPMSFNNSTQCRREQSSCKQCIYNKHCMEYDRQYTCSWFQQKEEENKCGWNMQEKRNPI